MTSMFTGGVGSNVARLRRELVFSTTASSSSVNGDEVIEPEVSPHEMRRVRDEFGALDIPYTEQVRPPPTGVLLCFRS